MVRWLPLLFLATACTTVSPKENKDPAAHIGGIVASGTHHETFTGSNLAIGPYVQVRGTVMCGNGQLRPPGEYRAEIYRGKTPTGAMDLDQRLSFDFLRKSAYGSHEARLVEKRSGRVLDKHAFTTTPAEDRFDIIFVDCAPTKTLKQ